VKRELTESPEEMETLVLLGQLVLWEIRDLLAPLVHRGELVSLVLKETLARLDLRATQAQLDLKETLAQLAQSAPLVKLVPPEQMETQVNNILQRYSSVVYLVFYHS
jgi:hypothetical protein